MNRAPRRRRRRGPLVIVVLVLIAAALIAWSPAGPVTYAATALLGFALAPVFPTLIAATPDRVGPRFAAHAIGFQVAAAAAGIATFPGVVASLARRAGLEIVCTYLIVATIAVLLLHEALTKFTGRAITAQTPPVPAQPLETGRPT